jgi:hypothetical protein
MSRPSCRKCLRWIYAGNFVVTGELLGTCTITEITTSEFSICPGFKLKPEKWEQEICGMCAYFDPQEVMEKACKSSGGSAKEDEAACPFWQSIPLSPLGKKLVDIKERHFRKAENLSEFYKDEIREEIDDHSETTKPKVKDRSKSICLNCQSWAEGECKSMVSPKFSLNTGSGEQCNSFLEIWDRGF